MLADSKSEHQSIEHETPNPLDPMSDNQYGTGSDLKNSEIRHNNQYYNNNLYKPYESNISNLPVNYNSEVMNGGNGEFNSNIRDFEREDSEPVNDTENNLAQNLNPSEFDVERQESNQQEKTSPVGFNESINAVKVSSRNSNSSFYENEDDDDDEESDDFNLRSTIAHLQGDLIYAVGVFISAVIINLFPNLRFVDSLCTFLFSYVAVELTFPIFAESSRILLEGIPEGKF